MGQAQQQRRAILIVEDDAELRSLMAALFEDEELDTIECESAEAALATLLIGGREVAMIFADVRLCGVMDGIDLAREVKMRWPLLPVLLTSGHPRERVGECRLHVQAVAAAQRSDCCRTGASVWARQLMVRDRPSNCSGRFGFESHCRPRYSIGNQARGA
jgi:CheY-like chemotaxis protein